MEFGILVDVAIGVLAVLVLFSIATSAVNEFIADWIFRLRGKALAQAIEKLLERELARADEIGITATARKDVAGAQTTPAALKDMFYDSPDIRVLMNGDRLPSAIEARRYALTVLKLMGRRSEFRDTLKERVEVARAEAETAVRRVAAGAGQEELGEAVAEKLGKGAAWLTRLGDESVGTVDAVLARLEGEFDEVMDRVSGWYLRRTKVALFVIGFFLAMGSNIDVLRYADRMLTAGDLSARIDNVAALLGEEDLHRRVTDLGGPGRSMSDEGNGGIAGKVGGAGDTVEIVPASAATGPVPGQGFGVGRIDEELDFILGNFDALDVKVGWDCRPEEPGRYNDVVATDIYCGAGSFLPMPSPSQAIGWVLIAFGVTFGAQMWFDLVKRLVRLRTSGLTGGLATRPGM